MSSRRTIYLIMAIASFILLMAVVGYFVFTMITEDIFLGDVMDIMMTIFLFLGMLFVSIVLMVVFMIKFMSTGTQSTVKQNTKRCVSCGTQMGIYDVSCPRCFSIQPNDGRKR